MSMKYLGIARQVPTNTLLYQIVCPHCGKEMVLEVAVVANTIHTQLGIKTGEKTSEPLEKPKLQNTFQGRQVA